MHMYIYNLSLYDLARSLVMRVQRELRQLGIAHRKTLSTHDTNGVALTPLPNPKPQAVSSELLKPLIH